jgi:D-sedoheptulose 7-phosphate isomerase
VFREVFEEHERVFESTVSSQMPALEATARLAEQSLRSGGKILIFGNGGSAADAQHFAAELVGRFEMNRHALPALALTVNTSTLTAVANDYGFDQEFSRQVQGLGKAGDLAIAISTSGNSPNVVKAAQVARELGCKVVGLTGEGGGMLAEHCDALIAIPAKTVARIQEMHEICLHALAWWLERRLFTEAGTEEAS